MGEQKGLAFFRKLAEMKPQVRTGHTLLAELVAAGEIPLVATIYNHNAERLLVNGAPIKWKALDPTFGRPNAVAVTKRAQRPHAALLFVDFMLSPEGPGAIKQRNRVPASTEVETNLNKFPFHMIDPVIVLDERRSGKRSGRSSSSRGRRSRGKRTDGQGIALQQQEGPGLRPGHPGPVQPQGRAEAPAFAAARHPGQGDEVPGRPAVLLQAFRRAGRRHDADAAHPPGGVRPRRVHAEARPRQRGGVLHP